MNSMKMLRSIQTGLVVFVMLSLCLPVPAQAEVEWSVTRQLDVGAVPLDVAVSQDGKMMFVLVPREVIVYGTDEANVIARIPVEEGFDRITHSVKDNTLILTDRTSNVLHMIQLEEVYTFDVSYLAFRGAAEAPVTIVVFSDYQCPYCARLGKTLQQVLEKHPEDIKLVFKNYPLSIHKSAREAALAALAAKKQEKFWEVHDLLFENYKELSTEKIEEIVQQAGLDMEKFAEGKQDPEFGKLVDMDIKEARVAGVRGTPTVFINGKMVKQKSLKGFEEAIENELSKRKEKE